MIFFEDDYVTAARALVYTSRNLIPLHIYNDSTHFRFAVLFTNLTQMTWWTKNIRKWWFITGADPGFSLRKAAALWEGSTNLMFTKFLKRLIKFKKFSVGRHAPGYTNTLFACISISCRFLLTSKELITTKNCKKTGDFADEIIQNQMFLEFSFKQI